MLTHAATALLMPRDVFALAMPISRRHADATRAGACAQCARYVLPRLRAITMIC